MSTAATKTQPMQSQSQTMQNPIPVQPNNNNTYNTVSNEIPVTQGAYGIPVYSEQKQTAPVATVMHPRLYNDGCYRIMRRGRYWDEDVEDFSTISWFTCVIFLGVLGLLIASVVLISIGADSYNHDCTTDAAGNRQCNTTVPTEWAIGWSLLSLGIFVGLMICCYYALFTACFEPKRVVTREYYYPPIVAV